MDENGVKLACFEICGEKFAFNMDFLVEIVQVQYTDITPFFSPVPIVRGKWEYRDTFVYIIDVRDMFGLEDKMPNEQNGAADENVVPEQSSKNVLVVKIHDQIFGLLTDMVSQMQPLTAFYEYPNMISTLPKRYFAGVTTINAELVLILAIEEFINDDELEILLSRRIGEGTEATHPFAV